MDSTTNTNPTAPLQSTPAVQPSGVKKKILVVDDEPDARELFAELLKTNTDYEVEAASDGNEALAKAEKLKFDLILLDIVMPNLDGVDTLATIKGDAQKYGNPIVVMLTNIGGDIAIQEAIKLGAIGYKLKIDTEPEELMQTVAQVLSGKGMPDAADKTLSGMQSATLKTPETPAMPTEAPAAIPAPSPMPAPTPVEPAAPSPSPVAPEMNPLPKPEEPVAPATPTNMPTAV